MNDFWVNFFANLFATLLAALLIYFVGRAFGLFVSSQPDLIMVAKQNGSYSDVINFSKQDDGSYAADFQLAIKNEGDITFKANEGFWHTYIMTVATITLQTAPGEFNHQRGVISYSIYPGYIVDIDGPLYRIIIKKGDVPYEGLPYFFATDYGFFPKKTNFNSKTGLVDKSTIGLIKFKLP